KETAAGWVATGPEDFWRRPAFTYRGWSATQRDWLFLVEQASDHESHVRRALTEPAHEVGEPVLPERHVDPDPVPFARQPCLQVAPDAVEELKLEALRRDRVSGGERRCRPQHRGIVGGDGGLDALGQQQLHDVDERGIDLLLLLIRDVTRLAIGALHQAYTRAKPVQASDVVHAGRKVRLHDDARVAIALLPERLEHVEGHLRVARVFHVDSDEELVRRCAVEAAA